jgi:hypothetical protein
MFNTWAVPHSAQIAITLQYIYKNNNVSMPNDGKKIIFQFNWSALDQERLAY